MFPGAAIIGHELTRSEAIAFGPPADLPFWYCPKWDDLTLDAPFVTFSDQITLHAGDLKAQVQYVGMAAHTTNDSIVWIPERSVLFCGDLIFNGGTPFMLMGSVRGAIDVLENVIRPLGAEIVVPGHGPVFGGCSPIDDTVDYLRFVLELAERCHRDGLHRAYAEHQGAPPGAPVDVVVALSDMVAYNDGAPLTCLA